MKTAEQILKEIDRMLTPIIYCEDNNMRNDISASGWGKYNALRELRIFILSESEKCEHEPDGIVYTSLPPKLRCVKCKEWYK